MFFEFETSQAVSKLINLVSRFQFEDFEKLLSLSNLLQIEQSGYSI